MNLSNGKCYVFELRESLREGLSWELLVVLFLLVREIFMFRNLEKWEEGLGRILMYSL